MIAGFVIWSAVFVLLLGIGVWTRRSGKAAGFYTGVKPPEVTDVRAYNRSVSVLWFVYAVLFGVASPLGQSNQVVAGIAAIAIWRDMGYCMLIYIAGLKAIPNDYYESATLDGANALQVFTHITLPLLMPSFTANVTLLLAWGLRCFDYPMAVARNMEAAQTSAMFVYDYIFGFSKAGLGQASAVMLTIVLVLLTRVVTHFFRKSEVEA